MRNTATTGIFEKLTEHVEDHNKRIAEILTDFERKQESSRERTKLYKASQAMYADEMKKLIPETRSAILTENAELSDALNRAADGLHEEMQNELCHALPRAFCEALNAYKGTELKPSRSELEMLTTLADGHPLAHRLINALSERSKTGYYLPVQAIEDKEKDLEALRKIAQNLLFHPTVPTDQIGAAVKVFGETLMKPEQGTGTADDLGSTVLFPAEHAKMLNEHGELVTTGEAVDFVSLNSAAVSFETEFTRFMEAENSWTKPDSFPELVKMDDAELELAKQLGEEAARAKAHVVLPEMM